MKLRRWSFVFGADVEQAIVRGESMDDLVLRCQAVYVWRRRLDPPAPVLFNPQKLQEWLEKAVRRPFSRIGAKDLSHFLHVHGISLGGGPLTDEKQATLFDFLKEQNSRTFMGIFLNNLTQLSPPLYVGETNDLHRRIRDHVRGKTQFAVFLKEMLDLTWSDVELGYWGIAEWNEAKPDTDRAKAIRTLLELIVARLAFAGSVSRPG